jgi:hypothetical protein
MKIFISYRRDDSAGYAGRLFDYLSTRFGTKNIFMDIDTIEPGQDFRKAISNAVGTCDVVLVMIGKQWASMTDSQGRRRLDDPQDWVRMEVASALANPRVRVIPVLVRNATMPGSDELPDDLKELSWRHAIELSDTRFQHDASELANVIEGIAGEDPNKKRFAKFWRILGASALIVTSLGLIILTGELLPKAPTPEPTLAATNVPTPTSSPTSTAPPLFTNTPAKTLSPAVQTMVRYYTYINEARISEDLSRAWDLLTTKLQCNPADNCSFAHYRDWWWQLQVQYRLYDCGSNTVDARLLYHARGAEAPSPSAQPNYIRYVLIDDEGTLRINSAEIVTGISAYCEWAASFPEVKAPMILGIETRETGSAPNKIIFADINFRDADGDSYNIRYELVSVIGIEAAQLRYDDYYPVPTASGQQVTGTIVPLQWDCGEQAYRATFDVIILDEAGNQSNKLPVTFDCR